jgi:hypothetical protein
VGGGGILIEKPISPNVVNRNDDLKNKIYLFKFFNKLYN